MQVHVAQAQRAYLKQLLNTVVMSCHVIIMHSNEVHQWPYKTAVPYVTWTPQLYPCTPAGVQAHNGFTIIMDLQFILETLQQLCELTQQCDKLNVCCTGSTGSVGLPSSR